PLGVARMHVAISINGNIHRLIWTGNLQRRAELFPAVRLFALIAVLNLLREHPVLIVDAVAESRHAECRHRFKKARSQAAEAAVAQSRVDLRLEYLFEVDSVVGQRLTTQIGELQIAE